MEFLKNLSIRSKLVLISSVPLLVAIYFLYTRITREMETRETMVQVYEEFEEIEHMSRLLHEFQIERAHLSGYIATGLEIDQKAMINQRQATDIAVENLRGIYQRHAKNSVVLPFLDSLPLYRNNPTVYSKRLNQYKVDLLREIGKTLRTSRHPVIKNQLESHLFLLYSKEYFAQLRSLLHYAIADKQFGPGQYPEFASLKGRAEINFSKFQETASADFLAFTNQKLTTDKLIPTRQIIDSLFLNPSFVRNVSSDQWWVSSTNTVNVLKELENYSLAKVKQFAANELAKISQDVYTSLLITTLAIILIALIVAVTIRHIVSTISAIRLAAERITTGEVDVAVPVSSRDEMGSLVESFNRMIEASKKYAEVAETIGAGEYEVEVPVRSKSDVLGLALNNMRKSLRQLASENEMRTWLLTGNDTINNCIRGDKDLHHLSEEVVNGLATYLRVPVAAVYIRDNGQLIMTASYAIDEAGLTNRSVIRIGEGLVGQAAKTGKPIMLHEVPDGYLKITSGLGDTDVAHLLVYPFEYEGQVKGVIEIGSIREISAAQRELLQMVSNNIGIAVHAAQSRERLKQLLEETQRQAEELESQQEELKQFNEELQEKTEILERSEEELKAQHEELQHTIEELAEKARLLEEQKAELHAAKMEITEKINELEVVSQYKSEFLANMSHELRTPLNSILILTQVLVENRESTLNEKEIQYVNTIHHSGNDLLNLINQILDLSKIEAGKIDLDFEEFSIGSVIQSLTASFEPVSRSKSIDFTVNADELTRSVILYSDKQRLEQVLKNFLSNAFKFTESGGHVTLEINKPTTTAFNRSSLKTSRSVIAFKVTDNGIGIPREKLELIFNAFQQVDGSTKRKYGGTGLGLSISRELCQILGGEIQVESVEGSGSAFTLFLPVESNLNNNEKQDPLPLHFRQPVQGAGPEQVVITENAIRDDRANLTDKDRKILIIEDDVQFSGVLLNFVRERKYKGIVAFEGNTGLHYARQYRPDAIFLDMKLPLMDGEEVLKQLKFDPVLRHIPVQIISGQGISNEGLRQGALDIIRKPLTRDEFFRTIERIEQFVAKKTKKLLIVEDDVQHNLAVKELVGDTDVECHSAFSGREGIEMLLKHSFDCIIIDIGLPDMTGYQFLEQIRQNENLRRIPVIVYTGKHLSREDNAMLEKLASTVVIKTAHSHERLLDETALFLHRVEAKLPKEKQKIIRTLHKAEEVLRDKTVLIADDDVRNLFSLVTVLEQEGMKCLTAENGREAVEILKANPSIDIVLMDVMMPEVDGYESTIEIRKEARFKNLPVIALTAKAMKGDREKCLSSGMSDYISKPLNVNRLVSLMRVWLYS